MPIDRTVAFLDDVRPDELHRFGGKAVNTSRLYGGGFRVPCGFSVSGECYGRLIREAGIRDFVHRLEAIKDLEEMLQCVADIQARVEDYDLPQTMKTRILDAKSSLEDTYGIGEFGYAVRSSATIEDGTSFSFAGQAESCLCVKDESSLLDSVKKVWLSALTPRAVLYLQSKNMPLSQVRMSVMVQQMIPADVSGVLFTANVVTSNEEQVLIEAVRGLGEPLVSGKVTPDTYFVDRQSLELVEQHLGKMDSMLIAGNVGPKVMSVPDHLRGKPVLDKDTIRGIVKEGLRIEELMGSPQDIEWGLMEGSIVILQTRPITTM